ncbi:hypothetical protein SAMD00019534_117510 [Acytostelium subglobosum LB1]|uniref:hypothetical protein n=1 Tax=Acytostelium subglobosum LB1 TaxID=1410327 RepID=UPI000644F399|nr:hypothetical protein SAMD00019534_117510 [Acytostelium subglobosum LB1]GAM28575.1 hypothetical protein SAMD00019534_117510 [Acytostelium subglobosum LB1]|eukprot:XP_012748353.1 hypothetical protein SAMD00019534_117510 [Acytostelium subglobosum LB1]
MIGNMTVIGDYIQLGNESSTNMANNYIFSSGVYIAAKSFNFQGLVAGLDFFNSYLPKYTRPLFIATGESKDIRCNCSMTGLLGFSGNLFMLPTSVYQFNIFVDYYYPYHPEYTYNSIMINGRVTLQGRLDIPEYDLKYEDYGRPIVILSATSIVGNYTLGNYPNYRSYSKPILTTYTNQITLTIDNIQSRAPTTQWNKVLLCITLLLSMVIINLI